ncbi:MAG: TolC family protein [Anaerolineae bacterium]|nr:TolC family protein [Phycisphaerae bacterium]
MIRPRSAQICLIALMLCGCAVNQEKEVAKYRGVIDTGVRGATVDPLAPGESLTLRRAMLLTNQNNENLNLSGEDYLQAMIDKDRAFASFLPTISLRPAVNVRDRGRSDDNDDSNTNTRRTTTDVPLSGEMNLFNGFRDIANLRRSVATIDQRRELLLDLQQTLLLDTAQAFYAVLRAERSVDVLRSSLAVQDERLRDVRGKQQAGLARPLDVAQTEAQASATRVSLLQAARDVQNARTALAFLIAQSIGDSPLLDELSIARTTESVEQILVDALEKRRDLLAARAAVLSTRQEVEFAVGQYYPSISLNVNYFLSRQSTPTDSDWNALFAANLPLFSAGLIEADVRTAWSRHRQARLDESLLSRQIESDVLRAHQNLISSDEQLRELQLQLAAAQQAQRQADESYRVGLATNLDRIQAQDQLLSTQLQLTSEEFNRKVFYLTLLRASGELIDGDPTVLGPTTQPTQ